VTWTYIIIVTAGPPLSSAFCFLLAAPVRSWPRFYFSWTLTGGTETVTALISRSWLVMLAALAGTAVAVIAWWAEQAPPQASPADVRGQVPGTGSSPGPALAGCSQAPAGAAARTGRRFVIQLGEWAARLPLWAGIPLGLACIAVLASGAVFLSNGRW
jgi:hypothetical protein